MLSAFLDNLTTVLLMVPITFLLADALDIDPLPLVIIEIIVSNIGGTATLIGDPPNIMIAGATELTFTDFIVNLAPIAAVTGVVVTAGCTSRSGAGCRCRRSAPARARARRGPLHRGRRRTQAHGPILLLTILAFFAHRRSHLEPATVALAGATVMLLVTRQPIEKALGGIEWPTLFFFMGLFVMVGALEQTGAIDEVAHGIASSPPATAAPSCSASPGRRRSARDRRQHPVHRRDDPGRRAASG